MKIMWRLILLCLIAQFQGEVAAASKKQVAMGVVIVALLARAAAQSASPGPDTNLSEEASVALVTAAGVVLLLSLACVAVCICGGPRRTHAVAPLSPVGACLKQPILPNQQSTAKKDPCGRSGSVTSASCV